MKKLILNLLILIILFFIFDYYVFYQYKYVYNISNGQTYIENLTKEIATDKADKKYMDVVFFREPLNEENDGKSIVFTGCSNIYGWGLNADENISGQFAKYVSNPVYNLSYPGWGLNNILYLVKSSIFFDKVKKEPAVIVFSWADFHVQRGIVTFSPIEMNEFFYKLKDGKLDRKKPPFFISRFAFLSLIRQKYVDYLLNKNDKFAKEQIELNKAEFLEYKHLLEKKYKDAKFIILLMYNRSFYENVYFNQFSKELENEGFIIINIPEELGIDIDNNEKNYKLEDGHPSALYWEETVPQLVPLLSKYL